ncbi:MAG: endonuclease MutS2 [Anaerovoracaceae bacterium]
MDQKALKVLEYGKIIEKLSFFASSQLCRDELSNLSAKTHLSEIEYLLKETSEALYIIKEKGPLPLGNFYALDNELARAEKGGALTMGELLRVLYNVNIASKVLSFMKSDLGDVPIVRGITELISYPQTLRNEIERCILSEDEMADDASPQLRTLRRSIDRQKETIKNRINQIISSRDNQSYLQDALVTLRGGRYVIPVKQEYKTKISGIVHDQSGSGATLFIEPQIVVDLNNQLKELEMSEKAEVERILGELSREVAGHSEVLRNNQELFLKLDMIFAKGLLSYDMEGTEPKVSKEGGFNLIGARHPLIDKDKVVPVTVSLGEGYHSLIITGPNTGGKTVTLKTAGLLLLMAQSGLHIPAKEGTRLRVFNNIFADIGDEQSIEQSLSTFSSHMTNIVNIVNSADSESLVLLDELGAGTDPTEGAALGVAILKDLAEKGAYVIATTHYTELKKYALSTEGVENASMEFDIKTLSPTFRVIMGVPGRSNAFEIASKLGLNQDIIERSRLLLDENALAFEDVVTKLNHEKKEIENLKDEALLLTLSIKKQKKDLESREKAFELKKDKILSDAKTEAKTMVKETKEELTKLIQEAKEEKEGLRSMSFQGDLKKKLREKEKEFNEGKVITEETADLPLNLIKPGVLVKVAGFDQEGEVLTDIDDKGDLSLRIGIMKVTVNSKDITSLRKGEREEAEEAKRRKKEISLRSCPVSIDVRGENLEDALMKTEKYIDDAFLSGLKKVTVIHGRGEGILRKGLQDAFRKNRHVKGFKKGDYDEGGDGVTVLEIK